MSTVLSRRDVEEAVLAKAEKDSGFRAQFLKDPKDALKNELGIGLPDSISIVVHEETPNVLHFVLPSSELSEVELDAVAGGGHCSDLSY